MHFGRIKPCPHSTLSQKSATVAENGETTATVAKFGDSRTFLQQCGQAFKSPENVSSGHKMSFIAVVSVSRLDFVFGVRPILNYYWPEYPLASPMFVAKPCDSYFYRLVDETVASWSLCSSSADSGDNIFQLCDVDIEYKLHRCVCST